MSETTARPEQISAISDPSDEVYALVAKGWLRVTNRRDPSAAYLIPPESLWTNRPRCFDLEEARRLQRLLEVPSA